MKPRPLAVSIVGRRLPDNENLAAACLVTALRAAGFEARFHALNEPRDVHRVAAEIVSWNPSITGFSLPDGGSAYLPLALGFMLRRRGYGGHITCGGPFATLARQWLLQRYGWLDSVVRFAGEIPIVKLAGSIQNGSDLGRVPGLTTRKGDGAPAAVLDPGPLRTWPERDLLPEVVGHPMANVMTSRGCRGRCAYCGPAALQELEVKEGLAGGASRRDLACFGVGGQRQRDVEDLCDEMAALWHERHVRYFNLVDEHPLPWNEDKALEYLAAWRRGLGRRGVGAAGIGTMMRADRITPRIARAFVETGLVRAFVGFELVGPEESRRFKRPPMSDRASGIIELLESMGVATVSNLMLVHPYSTPETIRAGIDFMASAPAGLFETTRMQVYHGTRLHRAMLTEGRLTGNPLRYNYAIEDPTARRFDEILTRLRMECFEDHSACYRAHDMKLALALRRRLEGRSLASMEGRCDRICRSLRKLQVRTLGAALDLAARGAGFSGCSDLVAATRAEVEVIRGEIDELSARISQPAGSRPIFSHVRAAAATALRVLMLGAPLAACDSSTNLAGDGVVDVVEDEIDEARECTSDDISDLRNRIEQAARDAEPCFSGSIEWSSSEVVVRAVYDWEVGYCQTPENAALLAQREARVKEAVEALGLDPGCAIGPPAIQVYIEGEDMEDDARMHDAAAAGCPDMETGCEYGNLDGTVITVDPEGRVVDVGVQNWCELPAETLACILEALEGLTFPCLAGYQVCPEPILFD